MFFRERFQNVFMTFFGSWDANTKLKRSKKRFVHRKTFFLVLVGLDG